MTIDEILTRVYRGEGSFMQYQGREVVVGPAVWGDGSVVKVTTESGETRPVELSDSAEYEADGVRYIVADYRPIDIHRAPRHDGRCQSCGEAVYDGRCEGCGQTGSAGTYYM